MNELTPADLLAATSREFSEPEERTIAEPPASLWQRAVGWFSGAPGASGDRAKALDMPSGGAGSLFSSTPLVSGRPPVRGSYQMLRSYEDIPQLRAVIDKIGQGVSTTPWRILRSGRNDPLGAKAKGRHVFSRSEASRWRDRTLKRIQGVGHVAGPTLRTHTINKLIEQEELQEVEGHPVEALLTNPNGQMTSTQAIALIQGHLDLVGESFGLIERLKSGNDPRELWPMPPPWVTRLPQPGRNSFDIEGGGFRILNVDPDNIIWFKHLSMLNPYGRGSGLGATLNDELDADEYAARTIANTFWNEATPGLLVQLKGVGKAEAEAFKAKFVQQHMGFLKSRAPFVTDREFKVEQFNPKFTDLQLVELRRFLIDRAREVFGVPPEIMGDAKDSNRATISAAQFIMAINVTSPRLIFLEDYINTRLIPKYTDDEVIIAFESPVPADMEFIAALVKELPWAFSIDEIRCLAEHEPIEKDGGKVHAIPFSVTLKDLTEEPAEEDAEEPAEDEDDDEQDILFGPPTEDEGRTLRVVPKAPPVTSLDLGRISGALVDVPFEPELRPVLTQHVAEWVEVFEDRTGIRVSDADIIRDMVRDELSEFAGQKIKLIDDFTLEGLRSTLTEGIKKGEDAEQLEQRVLDIFEGASRGRARTIARTEVNRAANTASHNLMEIAKVEEREWVALFANTRDTHADMDGQRRGLDQPFRSPSGATAMHPGGFGVAREDINCNCTMIPVRDERSFDRGAYKKAFDRTTERWSKRTATAVAKYFEKQRKAVVKEVRRQAKSARPATVRITA